MVQTLTPVFHQLISCCPVPYKAQPPPPSLITLLTGLDSKHNSEFC